MRRESGAGGPAQGARSESTAVMTAASARAGARGLARFGRIDDAPPEHARGSTEFSVPLDS
jgi:hypothetical protein